jgi:hypothetical protein
MTTYVDGVRQRGRLTEIDGHDVVISLEYWIHARSVVRCVGAATKHFRKT